MSLLGKDLRSGDHLPDEKNKFAVLLKNAKVSQELSVFNNIVSLNWAWIYKRNSDDDEWTQFECINCMIIESKYQKWKEDDSITFQIMVDNKMCTILFNEMVAEVKVSGTDESYQMPIERTEKNTRSRPDAEQRFQGNEEV